MDYRPRLIDALGARRRAKEQLLLRRAVTAHSVVKLRLAEARQQECSDRAEAIERLVPSAEAPVSVHDLFALGRELEALHGQGVQSHKVAHTLIAVGGCPGPATPKAIKTCEGTMRQWRLRYRRSRSVTG